jgi:hypothetical protein
VDTISNIEKELNVEEDCGVHAECSPHVWGNIASSCGVAGVYKSNLPTLCSPVLEADSSPKLAITIHSLVGFGFIM